MDCDVPRTHSSFSSKYKYLPMLKGIKDLDVPQYFEYRDKRRRNIIHIGLNSFFKGHLPNYIHHYLSNHKDSPKWGIDCIDLDQKSFTLKNSFKRQDCIYTYLKYNLEKELNPFLIGTILDYSAMIYDSDSIIRKISNPDTEILSVSLDRISYDLKKNDDQLDLQKPQILHDIKYPESPKTFWGILLKSLEIRIKYNRPPLVILSLDDTILSGDILFQNLLKFAVENSFPYVSQLNEFVFCANSISFHHSFEPIYDDLANLFYNYGIKDECSVFSDFSSYWIIDHHFKEKLPHFLSEEVILTSEINKYFKIKNYYINFADIFYLLFKEVVSQNVNNSDLWNELMKVSINYSQIYYNNDLGKIFDYFKHLSFRKNYSISSIKNLGRKVQRDLYPLLEKIYHINSKLVIIFFSLLYIYFRNNIDYLFLSDFSFYEIKNVFKSENKLNNFFKIPSFYHHFFSEDPVLYKSIKKLIGLIDKNNSEQVILNYLFVE